MQSESNQGPSSHFPVPAGEIHTRIARIQDELRREDIGGLLVVQRVDLFYFSGTAQNGLLYVPAEGDPLLMVKKYLPRAAEESPLSQVMALDSVTELPGLITDLYGGLPDRLGLELDVMPVRQFEFYRRLLRPAEMVDGSPPVHRVRMIKSPWEIAQMERTATLTRQTFDYIAAVIAPGMSELEASGLFEAFARKLGHGSCLRVRDYLTEGYPWHILSGESGGCVGLLDSPASGQGPSAAFPCGAGHRVIQMDEPIMVDFASVLNGYHMDETRMFAIRRMPVKPLTASQAAIDIHNELLEIARPGVAAGELYRSSVRLAETSGYQDVYLGPPGKKVRFVGHGIGLELIEPPILAANDPTPLMPGMTFALEPKMVFEGEFGVGIESVFAVTKDACRLISQVPVSVTIG